MVIEGTYYKEGHLYFKAKRVVSIVDAYFDKDTQDVLVGKPVNHPTELINDKWHSTGKILAQYGNLVETESYVYNILSLDKDRKGLQQLELF
jgi:hypothetical protein